MKKKLTGVILTLLLLQMMSGFCEDIQYIDEEKPPEDISAVVLNTVIMHDGRDNITNSFRPRNLIELMGTEGQELQHKLYTVYLNTNTQRRLQFTHEQTVKIFRPGGTNAVLELKTPVRFDNFYSRYGTYQRAIADEIIPFPRLNPDNPKNFGFYRVEILLSGRSVKEFLIPVLTSVRTE